MIRAQQKCAVLEKKSWKIIGNSEVVGRGGGSQNIKRFKGKYGANWNFWGVGGGSNKKKTFPGKGMNFFLNLTIFMSVPSFLFPNSNLIVLFPHVEIIKF